MNSIKIIIKDRGVHQSVTKGIKCGSINKRARRESKLRKDGGFKERGANRSVHDGIERGVLSSRPIVSKAHPAVKIRNYAFLNSRTSLADNAFLWQLLWYRLLDSF